MRSTITTSRTMLVFAALVALAAGAARADSNDPSQHPIQFQGSRTRAEVQAEAVRFAATHSTVPAGARVQPALESSVDGRELRAQAADAARRGLTPRGEIG
jgi:hypothetical protein